MKTNRKKKTYINLYLSVLDKIYSHEKVFCVFTVMSFSIKVKNNKLENLWNVLPVICIVHLKKPIIQDNYD